MNHGTIKLQSSDSTQDTLLPFNYFNKDSIKVGNNTFRKISFEARVFSFDLHNIPSNNTINKLPSHGIPIGITKYKGKDVFTLGPKLVRKNSLVYAVIGTHSKHYEELFFLVDRQADLSTLKYLQLELLSNIQRKATIITKIEGFNTYHIVRFRPFVFRKDLERYNEEHSYPPLPPQLDGDEYYSKEVFIEKGGYLLPFNFNTPLQVLNILDKNPKCVVQISKEISIEKYIQVLFMLEKWRDKGIIVNYYID